MPRSVAGVRHGQQLLSPVQAPPNGMNLERDTARSYQPVQPAVVSHKLSDMLHEAYGVDQYAIVTGIALEDLAAAGVASQSPDGWQLSAELLNAVASQLATVSETTKPATTVTAEHALSRPAPPRLRPSPPQADDRSRR